MHRFASIARLVGSVAASTFCLTAHAADNRALVIPSNSAGVNIPYQAIQAAPASSGAFTAEFWAKLDPATSAGRIFNRRGCSCNGITIVALNGSGSTKGLTVTIGGVYGSPGGAELPLSYGEWEHCAIVWSAASGSLKLYRNGSLVNTITGVGSQFEVCGTEPLRFAEQCGWGIKGAMDNIRYWSVARTAQQIEANKNIQFTASQAAQQPGLIGSWTFDDDTVNDGTGNNQPGTLQGGANIAIDNTVPSNPPPPDPSGFARFDSANDTIRIQGNTVFNQGDFTYEMRIRFAPGAPLGHVISEQRDSIEDKILTFAANGGYRVTGCQTVPGNGYLEGTLQNFPQDQWMHLAYVNQGSSVKFYVNGTLVQSVAHNYVYADSPDSWMSIGMFRYGAGWNGGSAPFPSFLGDLDWIRVSAGARYVGNFTPPYECEVNPDAQTQLLLKFNEPTGTSTLIDESSNAFVCDLGVPVSPGVKATAPTLGIAAGGYPACQPPCPSDVDQSGSVDGVDLATVLLNWGVPGQQYPRSDINGDGLVNGSDLAFLLAGWGPCP